MPTITCKGSARSDTVNQAVVAERLRRLTRNQLPSGSVGSNPTGCVHFCVPKRKKNHFKTNHSSISVRQETVTDQIRRLTRTQLPSIGAGSKLTPTLPYYGPRTN